MITVTGPRIAKAVMWLSGIAAIAAGMTATVTARIRPWEAAVGVAAAFAFTVARLWLRRENREDAS